MPSTISSLSYNCRSGTYLFFSISFFFLFSSDFAVNSRIPLTDVSVSLLSPVFLHFHFLFPSLLHLFILPCCVSKCIYTVISFYSIFLSLSLDSFLLFTYSNAMCKITTANFLKTEKNISVQIPDSERADYEHRKN